MLGLRRLCPAVAPAGGVAIDRKVKPVEFKADLVYDVGANNGDDAAHYLARGFRVLCVDADPSLAEALGQRFAAEVAAGRLEVLNAALTESRGQTTFWICEGKSLWNSFDQAVATREGRVARGVELECYPLRDLFARFGVPYYLKLSLHGQEQFCLVDIVPPVAPTYVSLELPRDEAGTRQVFARLVALGYDAFKVIDQTTLTQLVNRPPSARDRIRSALAAFPPALALAQAVNNGLRPRPEPTAGGAGAVRRIAGFDFPEGCSGPFGEDTDGSWQAARVAEDDYLEFLGGATRDGGPSLSLWHDLHARRGTPA